MKKFEATTLQELQPGDHFYFVQDEKKKVWERLPNDYSYPAFLVDGVIETRRRADTKVVFLNSKMERATE